MTMIKHLAFSKALPVGQHCTCTSRLFLFQFIITGWLRRVFVYLTTDYELLSSSFPLSAIQY